MTETPFTLDQPSQRVVFGAGTLTRVGEEAERLSLSRLFLVGTAPQAEQLRALAGSLGERAVAVFADAAMHTPVEVTQRALAEFHKQRANGVVALGGGSAIGLSKAIALRSSATQIVLPSTYAGSEMTPILGQTEGGQKKTIRDERVRPRVVIYDTDLVMSLPPKMAAASGLNAIAHAVEALYAADGNPLTTLMAEEAITALAAALPRILAEPSDRAARERGLYGAWLAGACLGSVSMGLHHKLCHALGGGFDLPHAETHAAVLPYALAHNAPGAPAAMARIARALGAPDAVAGMRELCRRLGAPVSLAALGLTREDLPRAVSLASAGPYPNPVPVAKEGVAALLDAAWRGVWPLPRAAIRAA
jgi:alcohol dehydrogenase class IV